MGYETVKEAPNDASKEVTFYVSIRSAQSFAGDCDDEDDLSSKETQTFIPTKATGTQTDPVITGISPEIELSYQERIKYLEEMLVKNDVNFLSPSKYLR